MKISKADQARDLFNQGYNIAAICTMVEMHYSHAMSVYRAWEKTSSQEVLIKADLNRNDLKPQSPEQFRMFFHNKDWSKLRECVASKATTLDAKETILDKTCVLLIDRAPLTFKFQQRPKRQVNETKVVEYSFDDQTYGDVVLAFSEWGFDVKGDLNETTATLQIP